MKSYKRRYIFIVLGILGIADTIAITMRSNMNLGVVMPALLGAPLLIYGLFYNRLHDWMKKGLGKFIKILFYAAYAIFFLLFIVCTSIMMVYSGAQAKSNADAIVILGAGIRQNIATISLKTRLDTAIEYINNNPKSIIVASGGQGPQETMPEATVMVDYLTQHGVDKSRIIAEDKSTSTHENFIYSKKILDEKLKRPYSVVYVTNDFHIYRAGLTAKATGLNATGLSSSSPFYLVPNNLLRETFAIVKTWVFGVD